MAFIRSSFRLRLMGMFIWRGPWLRVAMEIMGQSLFLNALAFVFCMGFFVLSPWGESAVGASLSLVSPAHQATALAMAWLALYWIASLAWGLWRPMWSGAPAGAGSIFKDALLASTGIFWSSLDLELRSMRSVWAWMGRRAWGANLARQALGFLGFALQAIAMASLAFKILMFVMFFALSCLGASRGFFMPSYFLLALLGASLARHAPWSAWRARWDVWRALRAQALAAPKPPKAQAGSILKASWDSMFEAMAKSLETDGAMAELEAKALRDQTPRGTDSKKPSRL